MTTEDSITPPVTGKFHAACLALPEMTEDEFRELARDIFANGQRHPIIVDEQGVILDGRHRWRAITEMGREPEVEVFRGTEEQKVARVMSENIHRRHLTTQQRGAIAAELATMKRGTRTDLASSDALSDAQAAKVMGVSEPTVERAKRRMREDPEAHAKAKAGTLPKAKPVKFSPEWDEQRRQQARENRANRQTAQFEQGRDPLFLIGQLHSALDWRLDHAEAWVAGLDQSYLKKLAHKIPRMQTKVGELQHVVKNERRRRWQGEQTDIERHIADQTEQHISPPEPVEELSEELAGEQPTNGEWAARGAHIREARKPRA
jgi:ParB-like chromosome segregation protein Spo0J